MLIELEVSIELVCSTLFTTDCLSIKRNMKKAVVSDHELTSDSCAESREWLLTTILPVLNYLYYFLYLLYWSSTFVQNCFRKAYENIQDLLVLSKLWEFFPHRKPFTRYFHFWNYLMVILFNYYNITWIM